MKLFIPGRICLFGEHSDWAGGYRRVNADVDRGYAIITGTNQGIYADVKAHPSKLIIQTTIDNEDVNGSFEIEMDAKKLLKEAETGGFYSYACGVAYQILNHYNVRGLRINNYRTDLPIKKGLSSSAAICVLVSRAFNRIYDLKMTVRGEMDYAYQGEITTPSRCGRMDQGCAYGNRPVMMTFDGDRLDVEELKVSKDLYFVVVDLDSEKDTVEILSKLNQCYPFPENSLQKRVHEYLGPINSRTLQEARKRLIAGDTEALGKLMTEAQSNFDSHLGPICPSQLTAPALHRFLNEESIQPYIVGGKGVGSQGDGCAQILARDRESQRKVMDIIDKKLGLSCLPLVIRSTRHIHKAVIPAAGFGTRLFPATKAVKKELFPIVDSTGRVKPAILTICEDLVASGIDEICLVIQERDRNTFEDLFHQPPSPENLNKLSNRDRQYSLALTELGNHISFITQDIQEGFGHAVYCAMDWIGEEPFVLVLGDHVFRSETEDTCTTQLLKAYETYNTNIVGIKPVRGDEVSVYGCVSGTWEKPGRVLNINSFVEKPTSEYAKEHLQIDGVEENEYMVLFGQYILTHEVFECLEESILHNQRDAGEYGLTHVLEQLRKEDGFLGYQVEGRSYDIGIPEKYAQTIIYLKSGNDGSTYSKL